MGFLILLVGVAFTAMGCDDPGTSKFDTVEGRKTPPSSRSPNWP